MKKMVLCCFFWFPLHTAFIQLSRERFLYILSFNIVLFTVPGAFSQHKSHEANVCLKNEQLKRQTYILQQPCKRYPLIHTVARAQGEAFRARKTLNYHI
jgi:hypothetical protein